MNFEEQLNSYIVLFEDNLKNFLNNLSPKAPKTIVSAMKYAVTDGGKRVRPTLLFASSDMLKVNKEDVIDFALAIELVHSYSLVHDDLPCMDNDDYRRGKFSTHKKFGENIGVLAGDALLNLAFEVMLSKKYSEKRYESASILGQLSGYNGMIAGQVLDLQNELNIADEDLLINIFDNKTSKLITAPLLISSIFADRKYYDNLFLFGKYLGILFQITDDILDVESNFITLGKTPHKDEEENKLTAIKVYGLNGAKIKAKEYFDKCLIELDKIPNSDFLKEFTTRLYNRKK